MEREHVNEDISLQPELKGIELEFLNKDDEPILDDTIGEAEEKDEYENRDIPDSGGWLSKQKKEKRNVQN
eukprot:6382787-Ditylum_brightwellii.AAC.1